MLGHKYFLTIVDDHNKFFSILMKFKSKTSLLVHYFFQYVTTQFNKIVKTIFFDNDPKFIVKIFYLNNWIHHQMSYLKTPKQNGILERQHQDLMSVTRALHFQSHIPKTFWVMYRSPILLVF